jgi:hypothetical protein
MFFVAILVEQMRGVEYVFEITLHYGGNRRDVATARRRTRVSWHLYGYERTELVLALQVEAIVCTAAAASTNRKTLLDFDLAKSRGVEGGRVLRIAATRSIIESL